MDHLKMAVTLFLIPISLCGCGSPKGRSEEKIIAKINNYSMTAEDFRDSARTVSGTKEEVLDQLITKNILVQEAQKEKFDKDKTFMKEIEKYWEQALLKLLIKKKTAEFSAMYNGDKDKIENALGKWIRDLRSRTNVNIYKDNLDEISIP